MTPAHATLIVAATSTGRLMTIVAESPLECWRAVRDGYFGLNAIRGLGTGAAFVLFLISVSLL